MEPLREIEMGLVGAVLAAAQQNRNLLAEIGGGTLRSCFHMPGVREVFGLCLDAQSDGHPLTVENIATMARRQNCDVDGIALTEWVYRANEWAAEGIPSVAGSYATQLRRHHARYEAQRLANLITIEASEQHGDVNRWLPSYLGQLAYALEIGAPSRTFSESVVDTVVELDALAEGKSCAYVRTGLADFDRRFGGLPLGLLSVIAGRPGMGKTALMLSWLSSMLAAGTRAGLASCEMSVSQCIARLLSMRANVALWKVVQGATSREERERLHGAAETLNSAPLSIDDQARTWPEILGLWERWVSQGAKVVAVDYLGQVQHPDHRLPRWAAVGEMTRDAFHFARRHQVVVLLVVQINRESVREEGKPPELHHLRESGAIEQDATAIVMVHRPAYYSDTQPAQLAELYLRKNRMGATGMSRAHWDKDRAMFCEPETYGPREDY